jgi:hypothetical protein
MAPEVIDQLFSSRSELSHVLEDILEGTVFVGGQRE